jgi:hypothetical protein
LYKDFIFLISIPFYTVEDISLMAKNRYDNFVHKINKIPSSQKMGDQGKKKKKKNLIAKPPLINVKGWPNGIYI